MIFAGYSDDISDKIYKFNPGLRSRFREIQFDDFDSAELRQIWDGLLERKRAWEVENETVSEVVVRRISKSSNKKGFGNARDVRRQFESAMSKLLARYLLIVIAYQPCLPHTPSDNALAREDFDTHLPVIKIEDVIGPRPSKDSPKLKRLVELSHTVSQFCFYI